jgi:diguanylate cyclase (GGDEF)-like protein/PAS domain S-box-containing protein
MPDRSSAGTQQSKFWTDRAWKWYLASAIPLSLLYLWLPVEDAKLYVWPVIGWSSVIAIVVGVKANRPSDRLAWYLVAAGVGTFILGDNLYSFRTIVQHAQTAFPSYVDVVYLAVYPFLVGGVALMVRSRSSGRDRAGAIDATIIAASLGLVSWVLLIAPYVRIYELSALERIASIAYPVGDVALLAIAARLAIGSGRRPIAFWLVAGSLIPLMASDSVYGYLNLAGLWHEHNPVDIGWIAFYMGWGAAALHPSMRELSIPAPITRRVNTWRLVVVGVAVLVPPAMLFVEGLKDHVSNALAIAIDGGFLLVLVLVRIAGLARDTADVKSEARFRAMVHEASEAVVVLDRDGRISYRTPSTERVLGWTAADLDERLLGDLLEEADRQRLLLMLSSNTTTTVEWRLRSNDGSWRDLEVVASDMRGTTDADLTVLTMRDITERKSLDQELRRQALHDSLTGLPNRTLFLDRVEQSIKLAKPTNDTVAVLLLDLDDFREVNDSVGHAAGDDLLIAVAARLTNAMPFGLTVARLGGDEFAVLLETGARNDELGFAALRVQAALLAPMHRGKDQLPMHASIGLAFGSSRMHTPDELLRQADLAMYVAKRNGKNRFELYNTSMHDEASSRLGLVGELRDAIANDELVVFYQPIVDVQTGRIVGAESLVRWMHPQRGLTMPNEFIPIAETSGLVVPIGRWMLAEACEMTKRWKDAGIVDDAFYISVNLSARHLQDNVLRDVTAALASSGLPARALVLEVTETGLIEDLNPAGSMLAKLKELGLRVAVDDFGTGYSSLAYLSKFPIDILKIDKSFVDQVATTIEGERMVRAVVDLARTLDLIAIAEGIEDPQQAAALRKLGCPLAQGYLFAKPMRADDMAQACVRQRHVGADADWNLAHLGTI